MHRNSLISIFTHTLKFPKITSFKKCCNSMTNTSKARKTILIHIRKNALRSTQKTIGKERKDSCSTIVSKFSTFRNKTNFWKTRSIAARAASPLHLLFYILKPNLTVFSSRAIWTIPPKKNRWRWSWNFKNQITSKLNTKSAVVKSGLPWAFCYWCWA